MDDQNTNSVDNNPEKHNGEQNGEQNGESNDAQLDALRSVHTTNFPEILKQLNISLAVSTYQAGKLIIMRPDNGSINTHFCHFKKPMGVAANYSDMVIGCGAEVWFLRNMPAVGHKVEPVGKYDSCYVPRRSHITGDIDIHEMAWDGDKELWIVNTKFSCLCTLDAENSFVPRWRPPFISALTPEDRCHLNGLAMVNGVPKYVTMLGESDEANGWRPNKARGGQLMDVQTNEVILSGLSMPHSPRVYNNQLWLLESGNGSLAVVDNYKEPSRASLRTVAQLPGFTRGISFAGPLAFIGLSQVRESAVFSSIPLVERLNERTCGVWVVNIENGETIAFLRFEEAVQEIFAVEVLPNMNCPDLVGWEDERLANSYMLPDEAMQHVPEQLVVKNEE